VARQNGTGAEPSSSRRGTEPPRQIELDDIALEISRGDVEAGGAPMFFSVAIAAQTLGVSDDTVYELVQRGALPCLCIGRRRVIPRRAVELVVAHLLADFDPGGVADQLSALTK
jgi:excisionase family DNA binding protein